MKLRWIAVFLILFTAAWLPIIAQPSPAPQTSVHPNQPAKPDQPVAGCCHGKDGSTQSVPCCEGQDVKDMPCCHKDALDKQAAATCCDSKDGKACCTKDAKNFANCCKGKDAKLRAKNGKHCCTGPECQPCCDKNTTVADTNSAAKTCCANKDHSCCHSPSNA